jgi:hypothetical protein
LRRNQDNHVEPWSYNFEAESSQPKTCDSEAVQNAPRSCVPGDVYVGYMDSCQLTLRMLLCRLFTEKDPPADSSLCKSVYALEKSTIIAVGVELQGCNLRSIR